MSRFKVELEVQGLKVKIEGAREDAPLIAKELGAQLGGLLQPASRIVEGEMVEEQRDNASNSTIPLATLSGPSKKRRRKVAATSSENEPDAAIDFVSDPSKYGNPRQSWKTADKAIWLIYVLTANGKGDQFSTRSLVETFNKHFKQSGTITTSNVTRDLGRARVKDRPPLIGEDTTKSPSTWFLTDEGRKRAQALVAEALNPTS